MVVLIEAVAGRIRSAVMKVMGLESDVVNIGIIQHGALAGFIHDGMLLGFRVGSVCAKAVVKGHSITASTLGFGQTFARLNGGSCCFCHSLCGFLNAKTNLVEASFQSIEDLTGGILHFVLSVLNSGFVVTTIGVVHTVSSADALGKVVVTAFVHG